MGLIWQKKGTQNDLDDRFDTISREMKSLKLEWADYQSKLDSLVRRIIRMQQVDENVVAAAKEPKNDVPRETPMTRAALFQKFKEQNR